MEKLLEHNNIRVISYFDGYETERRYAFSPSMLTKNIFIEFFTIEASDLEPDEVADFEDEEEDEEILPEPGSFLSVIMEHKKKFYEFLMYHDAFEIGSPVLLVQTILFLVKTIDQFSAEEVIEYLTDLAPDPLIPHEIKAKKHRELAISLVKIKLTHVHQVLNEGKEGLN